MKIKNSQLVTYGAATILMTGLSFVTHKDRTVIAAQETVLNKFDQIEQLSKQIDSLKKEAEESKSQKTKLIESLAVLESKEKDLSNLIQTDEDKKDMLISSLTKLEEEKQQLSGKLADIKKDVEQKESTISEKEDILAKYKEELADSNKNSDTNLTEEDMTKLSDLKLNKDNEEKKLAETLHLRESALEIIQSQEANIKEYEESLTELEKNPEENSNEIFAINSNMAQSKKILKSAQNTLNARNNSITRSEAKIKDYQHQIDEIAAKVTENQTKIDLQNKIEAITQELNSLNKDKTQNLAQIDDLLKQIEDITKQQNQVDLPELENNIQSLKQNHENLLNEINENKRSIQSIESKEKQLDSEISELSSQIDQLNTKEEPKQEKEDDKQIINLPNNEPVYIEIPSIPIDKSEPSVPTQDKPVIQHQTKKAPAIRAKKGTFFVKIGKNWKKVKPKYLSKYLDNKYHKLNMAANVKGKRLKIRLFDTKGKKTKHTIKRGKTIKVKGLKIIRKYIYMYIGNGKYISIDNVKMK